VHGITCRPIIIGLFLQEEVLAEEPGGQPREASRMLTFFFCARQTPVHIVPMEILYESCLPFNACDVLCTMCRILYDGNRLHGSTLLYIILVVDVLLL
jgi:hypothetical protein